VVVHVFSDCLAPERENIFIESFCRSFRIKARALQAHAPTTSNVGRNGKTIVSFGAYAMDWQMAFHVLADLLATQLKNA
jgi:hypothetical protein